MNEIFNKFLLAGDKFMPEMHFKTVRIYIQCLWTVYKKQRRNKKFEQTGDSRHISSTELHKACLQHGMVYGDFKDLTRRLASDKILRDKAFNIAKNLKYDGYQRVLVSMVYKFFDKFSQRY